MYQNDRLNLRFVKDECTYGKKVARNGRIQSFNSTICFRSVFSSCQWGLTCLSSDLTRDLNYITAAEKKIASLPFKIASKWTPTFKRVNWFHFVRVCTCHKEYKFNFQMRFQPNWNFWIYHLICTFWFNIYLRIEWTSENVTDCHLV